MKRQMSKRILSALLSLVMLVSLLPVSVFAEEPTTWTKVTTEPTDWSGTYLIVSEGDSLIMDGSLSKLDGEGNKVDVTITDSKIVGDYSKYAFTVAPMEGGYSIQSASGKYISGTSGKNSLNSNDSPALNTISLNSGILTIASNSTTLQYNNAATNGTRFRYYKSLNQQPIALYKLDAGGETPLETVETPAASVAAGDIEKNSTVTFSCTTEGASIQYKIDGGAYQPYTAPVAISKSCTVTVKATKEGMNDSAEATFAYKVYTLTSKYVLTDTIDTGDQVVIYNAKNAKIMTTEETTYSGKDQLKSADAVVTGDELTTGATSAAVLTVTKTAEGKYTFATADGKYLYMDNTHVRLVEETGDNTLFQLETATDGWFIKADTANYNGKAQYMEFYADVFTVYGMNSSKADIYTFQFYKLTQVKEYEEETQETVETPTASPAAGEVEKGAQVTFSCATEGAKIFYKTTGDYQAYTAPVTVDADTTFTVKATKDGMTDSAEATFAYTVKSEAATVPIATALAGETGTSFTVKGVVTLVDGRNIYLQDATGGICAYMAAKPTDISLGDTIIATGNFKVYNDLPELDAATYEKSSGLTLTAKATTIAALSTADVCTYVQLTNMRVIAINDNNGAYSTPNITLGDNEGRQIQLYKAVIGKDTEGNWEYAVDDCVDVKAAVGIYKGALQLRNTLASEITPHVEQENHIVTDLSELTDGAKVVIFNPANMQALSQNYTGFYNLGVPVTAADGKLSGYGATEIWTVGVNSDGSFTFSTADGKKFSMGASYTSTPLDDVNPNWNILPAATADCFYIRNTARGNYVEWYASKGNWSSYTKISDEALFAQQFYLVVKEEEQPAEGGLPKAGDQVVIYNASAEGVLAAQDDNTDSPSITGVGAEIVDGKAVPENGARVFTVEKNGDYFRFYNEHDGYLCSNGTGNNAFYSKDATDDADWTLAERDGGFTMESRTAKFNGKYSQYLEYYADSFKTYSMYNVTDYSIYTFHFYPVADGTPVTQGIVNKPAIVFGALPEAYVGQDYTFTFTIDAVFGVSGTPTAYIILNASEDVMVEKDGETYRITVPAQFLEGRETLTVHIMACDTLGTPIAGDAVFTILDEPVFSDLTPTAGSQTGEDKRPVISAKVANAGEEPTITMTLNGEEVTPKYEDGVVSYQSETDMADGRVNVTITVKRADGKEASKSWAFTVGTARYQLYFGQLHSHTTYSDGSGTLDAALDYVKNLPDSANVDFVAFTDHSNYFDKSGEANPEGALYDMSLATAYSQENWKSYKDAVAAFNASQFDVVAIAGFEMTWSGGPGHINTFNSPGIVSRNNSTLNNKTGDAGLKAYYSLLRQPAGADTVSQLNHPGSTFGTFSDFAYYDAVIDSRIFLVEVGNGEGQIGAGGYYPSYEYYTMALDKGWHVAPTNNQDNHKGKWGNANDARDVIITDDFSEEGIYAAIRAMRMYATEDKNLEISYTVNDMPLGSSIDVPDKLNINVTVNDPDASDSISKVEVIVNSGKTAYTWNDPAELASGALSVELDPDYSYYYIRVTEGDGDLAVTAPVWVGESLKLGISALECGTSTPVTGEELTLTTTFFNSEAADATVKSLTYTTNGSVVLGTDTTGYTIPASGTLAVDFKYTPDVAKVMTVTVTAVVEQDGKEYTFTKDISLDILNANSLVYVGIDASHYNEYVAGNYKDSMGNFGALAAEYSVRTVQLNTSEDLIAACANPKFAMLILTAPSRRNGTALRDPYATYSDEEIAAITAFNSNGGAVVLCGWGDFYESYASFPAEDHMAAQQNKILAALGSSLRISDDETKDDKWNGGQAQRLYLSSYNFDSFLLSGVEYDAENPHNNLYTELFSQYGGASIYTVGGTIPGTVTPVVYGFDTTYSSDDDKDNYGGLGSIPKYNFDGADRLMVMATDELPGRGLIVVSGAAFLSNFEVQASVEDNGAEKNYSNYKICQNLLQYVNPVTVTHIATVRAQKEAGYKYTIEGIVTSNASGYDKDTAFFDCIYVQDATGGICCFPVAGNYKIGDKVRITGTTDFFQGEPELQVTSIEKLSEGNDVTPTEVAAGAIADRSAEGLLVTVKGVVVSFEKANGLVQTIMVRGADGKVARVFIDGYITTSKEVENLALGAEVTVTGLASYDDTFNAPEGPFPRIRIRDRADVVCGEVVEHVHDYTWTVTKAPTCTKAGVETGTCVCGHTTTRSIPATGHVDRDGNKRCDVCGRKMNTSQSTVQPGTPVESGTTGDNSNLLLWAVMLTVSAMGTAVLVVRSKKRRA